MKKVIVTTGLLFLALLCVMVFTLFYTNIGINIAIGLISRLTEHQVSIEYSSGRLLGHWELNGVRVRSVAFQASVDRLAAEWHPTDLLHGTLRVGSLYAGIVEVTLAEARSDAVPRSDQLSLPEISLPLSIEVNEFQIEDLSIYRNGRERLFGIDHIALEASARNSLISITELVIRHPQFQTSLEGNLDTSMNWSTDLTGIWNLARDGCAEVRGEFSLSGTVDEMAIRLAASSPGKVAIEGNVFGLLDDPNWELDGTADLFLPDLCDALNPLAADLTFHTEGRPADYLVQVRSELAYPDLPNIEGSFSISGNEDRLVFDRSTIRFDNNDLEFSGQLSWKNDIYWSLVLSTTSFDFSHYQESIDGHANVALTSTGSLVDGRLRYSGSISDLNISIEEPDLSLEGKFNFQGDDREIEITAAQITTKQGLVELDGTFGWSGSPSWNVSGRFDHINPAEWGEFPVGLIQAEVHSNGSVSAQGVNAEATLASLTGEFAGYPIEGKGTVEYLSDELIIRELFLLSGPNSLAVDGTVGTSVDLRFSADAQDLARLHERLEGRLEMHGSIDGERQSPHLDFSAHANDFAFDDYRLSSLAASASFDQQGDLELTLAVDSLHKRSDPVEELVDKLEVFISGNEEDHSFAIDIFSGFGTLAVHGSGQIIDRASWSGTVQDLAYDHPLYGLWHQQESARVELSPEAVSLQGFCLSAAAGGICADGSWSLGEGWQAELSSLRFDVANLERWNLLTFPVKGELRGELHTAGDGAVVESGTARFYSEQLYLGDSADLNEDLLRFTDTSLSLELEDQVLKTSLQSQANYGSNLAVGLTIQDVGNPSVPFNDLPLDGTIEAHVENLSRLAALTQYSVIPEGRISADLQIGGVLNTPDLYGRITLEDGGLMLPDYGLHLQEIAGELQGDQYGLVVKMTARSGEGRGTIKGSVRMVDRSWTVDLDISGQGLQLLDQRELRIAGNPMLNLFISPEGGTLSGTIFIPRARIEPEEMTGSDTISRDTTFVDEEASKNDLALDLDLTIELGDDIQVEGYGFEGSLSGAMDLSRVGAGEIWGRGQIEIKNGTVSFMGRTIEISRGVLIFSDSPIDNPGLDIQARKVISREQTGTTDMVVGLNITGSVHDYHVELFSDPPLEEREIIAVLLLGRPPRPGDNTGLVDSALRFMSLSGGNNILGQASQRLPLGNVNLTRDAGQDNVSLAFNKQITNRLSAGYEVDLFDNQGLFRVRYSLPRGFSLEVRNSVDITGIELLYYLVK